MLFGFVVVVVVDRCGLVVVRVSSSLFVSLLLFAPLFEGFVPVVVDDDDDIEKAFFEYGRFRVF